MNVLCLDRGWNLNWRKMRVENLYLLDETIATFCRLDDQPFSDRDSNPTAQTLNRLFRWGARNLPSRYCPFLLNENTVAVAFENGKTLCQVLLKIYYNRSDSSNHSSLPESGLRILWLPYLTSGRILEQPKTWCRCFLTLSDPIPVLTPKTPWTFNFDEGRVKSFQATILKQSQQSLKKLNSQIIQKAVDLSSYSRWKEIRALARHSIFGRVTATKLLIHGWNH